MSLKKCCYFFPINFKFCAVKKNYKYLQRFSRQHGTVTVKDFGKYKKLDYKKIKFELDIDFLNSCKQPGLYPKFLIFKLSNVSNKDASSIRKKLLHSATKKRNKELQHV